MWEHTRLISYTLFAVNSTEKMSIREYMHLLTDAKPMPVESMAPEEQQKLVDTHLQILKNIKNNA